MIKRANIEQAENGYVIYLYREEGQKEFDTKRFVAKDEKEVVEIMKREFNRKEKKE